VVGEREGLSPLVRVGQVLGVPHNVYVAFTVTDVRAGQGFGLDVLRPGEVDGDV
jgi:hypothetical protein